MELSFILPAESFESRQTCLYSTNFLPCVWLFQVCQFQTRQMFLTHAFSLNLHKQQCLGKWDPWIWVTLNALTMTISLGSWRYYHYHHHIQHHCHHHIQHHCHHHIQHHRWCIIIIIFTIIIIMYQVLPQWSPCHWTCGSYLLRRTRRPWSSERNFVLFTLWWESFYPNHSS